MKLRCDSEQWRRGLDPGQWSVVAWLLLSLLLMAGSLLLCQQWLLRPMRQQSQQLLTTLGEQRKQLATLQQRADALQRSQSQLQRLERGQTQSLQRLPAAAALPAPILELTRVLRANGIEAERLEPGEDQLMANYALRPLSVRWVGRYQQLSAFVDAVAALQPALVLVPEELVLLRRDATEAESSSNGPKLELSGTLGLLRRLQRDELPVAGSAENPSMLAAAKLPASLPELRWLRPWQAQTAARRSDPFIATRVAELALAGADLGKDADHGAVMLGTVGQGRHRDALVRSSDGRIHRLKIGMQWGQARVLSISARTIELRSEDGSRQWQIGVDQSAAREAKQ